jgi:hypothetical protein
MHTKFTPAGSSSKEPTTPIIQREKFAGGVRLSIKPFRSKSLEIRAEIVKARLSRGPEVKVSFSGVTFSDSLRLIEAQTWAKAMIALTDEARSVVAELAAKSKRT